MGYGVGQYLIKAPEDIIKMEIKYEHALQGEIDIQILVEAPCEVSIDELNSIVSPLSFSLLSYINLALGDFLIPSAPIQITKLIAPTSHQFESLMKLRVWERKEFDKKAIQNTLSAFVEKRVNMSEQDGRTFDVAARRYLDSLTEQDPIDKYCDLWETCEFVTSTVRAKGGIVSRTAQTLASHMHRPKAIIENQLEIKRLYVIRKDIVHNAIENLSELEERTNVLEKIAFELIRYKVGLPYEGCNILEKQLDRS